MPCPAAPQVVNQIYWTQEVEEAFQAMAAGDKGAMKVRCRVWGCAQGGRHDGLRCKRVRCPHPTLLCRRTTTNRCSS